jgi:hypothetical protein
MCYVIYATVEDTLQIDVDFQVTLHGGMVWKSTPTIYSTSTIFRILNGGGRILNGGGRFNGGARFPYQAKPTQHI